jgi:hypothetical protein
MERMWASRLRWRLRGAWLAPLFVVLTIADGVLLTRLPLAGDGTDLVGGLLLAGFLNLVAVAAIAPFAGLALRRVRPDLPALVARDYAGAGLVVLVTAGLLAGGLIHHGTVVRNREAMQEALARGKAWIGANDEAPAEFRRHVELADVVPIVEGSVYRVCVNRIADADRAWCAVVPTDPPFPQGIRYGGAEPNARFMAGRW